MWPLWWNLLAYFLSLYSLGGGPMGPSGPPQIFTDIPSDLIRHHHFIDECLAHCLCLTLTRNRAIGTLGLMRRTMGFLKFVQQIMQKKEFVLTHEKINKKSNKLMEKNCLPSNPQRRGKSPRQVSRMFPPFTSLSRQNVNLYWKISNSHWTRNFIFMTEAWCDNADSQLVGEG